MHPNIPVMISGVYRSGTTFVNAAISCFEGYSSLSSGLKFMRFCFGQYGENLKTKSQLSALLEDCRSRLAYRWNIEISVEKILSQVIERGISYSAAYDLIMRDILDLNDKKISQQWCDKLVLGWNDVEKFLELFSHGMVIHIIRNPLDVLQSYKSKTTEPHPIYLDAIFNCYSSFLFAKNIPQKWRDRIIICKEEEFFESNSDIYKKLSTILNSKFNHNKFESAKFSTLIDQWDTNSERVDSISIGKKLHSINSYSNFTELESYLLETLCGSYMDEFAFPREYKPKHLSQSKVEEILGYKYLINRYRLAICGKDPGPSYFTNPIDLEWKIVNEKK